MSITVVKPKQGLLFEDEILNATQILSEKKSERSAVKTRWKAQDDDLKEEVTEAEEEMKRVMIENKMEKHVVTLQDGRQCELSIVDALHYKFAEEE